MLESGNTRTVRAFMMAISARSRDAAALYRQALLTRGDPALAKRVVHDVIVNEAGRSQSVEANQAGGLTDS
jgi:hypothetical protein